MNSLHETRAEKPNPSPEEVVQAQLEAYNSKDLPRILSIYAEDAEMFLHTGELLARGTDALRGRFSMRFAEPNIHGTLLHRIVMGNVVVDHELVRRDFPEGPGTVELLLTYEVVKGRICRVWVREGPRLSLAGS